jgi:hypothetical protein
MLLQSEDLQRRLLMGQKARAKRRELEADIRRRIQNGNIGNNHTKGSSGAVKNSSEDRLQTR